MEKEHVEQMQHRQITLADGRYLIFYTFGETDAAPGDAVVPPEATAELSGATMDKGK